MINGIMVEIPQRCDVRSRHSDREINSVNERHASFNVARSLEINDVANN